MAQTTEETMTTLTRFAAALLVAAASVLVVAPSAGAASNQDYIVVNTQDPGAVPDSPILDSGGAFESCTTVTDLWGIGEQIGPKKVIFIGEKQVNCTGGVVVIHYNAELNFSSGKRTSGNWFVVTEDTTLPGVSEGDGTVRGDNTRCTPISPSEFCILDTFSGTVS